MEKILKVKIKRDIPKNYTGIVEYPSGTKEWLANGERHRPDGPAIEFPDGTKFWYLNGLRHREDGPAIEYPEGLKYWMLNGILHREDGPAVEWSNGHREYWTDGKKSNKEKIEQLIKLEYPIKIAIKLSSL